MQHKKIVIAGGTGFIGQAVIQYFGADNDIIILTRNLQHPVNNAFVNNKNKQHTWGKAKLVYWNGKDTGEWCSEIDGCNIVINLTGKSVNCRYTAHNKQQIFDSRTNATKAIGKAIQAASRPPELWMNAASATIYRHATDLPQDEITGEFHNDFSVQVCKLWEQTFFEQPTHHTRKIALRMAIALGEGGVMIPYLNLCKFGLGGRQGTGKQMYSWVHVEDVCRVMDYMAAHTQMQGVYNVSSPNPVTNEVFMQTLRKVTGQKIGLPAAKWLLAAGAAIIGTEPELLLKSRWVIPTRLLQEGFTFKYRLPENAVAAIVQKLPRKAVHLF